MNTVLDFLNANKLTRFKSSFESIFQALRKDDLNQYSKAFGELEQLALTDPKNARKIEDFISSLR